jgi:putative peptide zinc metalloprotease protein
MIIPAYLLFLVSLFAHEFGHASACMKGGVEPSEIGVAVYLFFPVFYSDVSASWQLPRWQKVRVDIGGIYFQLCAGGIYLLLFIMTRQAMFQWAIFIVVSSCLVSLNPFMKFDGYWVLTDIMGVANLSRQPSYLLIYFYRAIFKKQQKPALRWSKVVCISILIYSLLSCVFWVYLIIRFLPLLYYAIISYPTLVASALRHLQYYNGVLLMVDLQQLAINALIIILYGGGIGRICYPLLWKLFATIKNSAWLVRRGGAL